MPSEINAAYLWAQLQKADEINQNRLETWQTYYDALKPFADNEKVELPQIPAECKHNAHMFYLKLKNLDERTKFINYMKGKNVSCVFHYVPLHSAPAGKKYCRFHGEDKFTTRESDRLVRLPLYYGMDKNDLSYIIKNVKDFFS